MIQFQIHGRTFRIDSKGFLSPAEELTLEDWLQDMRAQDAAQKRHRSVETVQHHRKHIREKTHAKSVGGVLSYCLCMGYIRVMVFSLCVLSSFPMARTNKPAQPTRKVETLVRIGRKEIPGIFGGAL